MRPLKKMNVPTNGRREYDNTWSLRVSFQKRLKFTGVAKDSLAALRPMRFPFPIPLLLKLSPVGFKDLAVALLSKLFEGSSPLVVNKNVLGANDPPASQAGTQSKVIVFKHSDFILLV